MPDESIWEFVREVLRERERRKHMKLQMFILVTLLANLVMLISTASTQHEFNHITLQRIALLEYQVRELQQWAIDDDSGQSVSYR